MRRELEAGLGDSCARARRRAVMGLWDQGEIDDGAALLPEACRYTLDQLLDEAWLPESGHGFVDPRA